MQRPRLVDFEFEIDLPEDDAKVRVFVFHAPRPAPAHGLHALQVRSFRRKAFRHFQLRRLQPVANVGQIGGAGQNRLHQWRQTLGAKLQLHKRVGQGQIGRQLADQIQAPRRMANVLFGASVRLHAIQAALDNVRF